MSRNNNDSKRPVEPGALTQLNVLDASIKSELRLLGSPNVTSLYSLLREEPVGQSSRIDVRVVIIGLATVVCAYLATSGIAKSIVILVGLFSILGCLLEGKSPDEVFQTIRINALKKFGQLLQQIETADIGDEEKIKRFFAVACLFYDHLPTISSERFNESRMQNTVGEICKQIRRFGAQHHQQALFDSLKPQFIIFGGNSNPRQLYFPNGTNRDDLVGIYTHLISQPLPQLSSSSSASFHAAFGMR